MTNYVPKFFSNGTKKITEVIDNSPKIKRTLKTVAGLVILLGVEAIGGGIAALCGIIGQSFFTSFGSLAVASQFGAISVGAPLFIGGVITWPALIFGCFLMHEVGPQMMGVLSVPLLMLTAYITAEIGAWYVGIANSFILSASIMAGLGLIVLGLIATVAIGFGIYKGVEYVRDHNSAPTMA